MTSSHSPAAIKISANRNGCILQLTTSTARSRQESRETSILCLLVQDDLTLALYLYLFHYSGGPQRQFSGKVVGMSSKSSREPSPQRRGGRRPDSAGKSGLHSMFSERAKANRRKGRLSDEQSTFSYSSNKERIHDVVPPSYLGNPKRADPILYYIPRLLTHHKETVENPSIISEKKRSSQLSLRNLIKAAEEDVRLHRARQQAGLARDVRLLRNYHLEGDPHYKERQERLAERSDLIDELTNQAEEILREIQDKHDAGLTQSELAQVHLARWQRAMELYVYTQQEGLDWKSIFEQLLGGISEDQDISKVLEQASELCSAVVETTSQYVQDTKNNVEDVESSYIVRLEAHDLYAQECLKQVGEIEEQFKTSGRAALQIGHQLELAELKRSQCEAASILIRRWWILENLAEQEKNSGSLIDVEAEVRGLVPSIKCKMDPLFIKPENSLEAAKALQQLRAVVRSRGNAAATGTASATMIADKASSRRFDMTASLITRTSDALEGRLLNSFSAVYAAGGVYDFSSKPRPGAIDWRELQALAQALLLFDSGRNLHKRYVDMVVNSRFPELFTPDTGDDDGDQEKKVEDDDFSDMDATRTKLSNLFRRVGDVCTAEFELISHVFGSENNRTDLLEGSEEMPLVVARALLQRVISDPRNGLQARINSLLASIDRKGDFDAGAKKLDTFVVVHEKAAGLFSLLKDAADNLIQEDDDRKTLKSAAVSDGREEEANSAVASLKGFLTSQELALSNTHRQSYINLELRVLHHNCCSSLDQAGCALVKGPTPRPDESLADKGIMEEYRAPLLPLHKETLQEVSLTGILAGPLRQSVLRQPLVHATDSLSRARLMFGTKTRGGEATSRVILGVYTQICAFYGDCFLYPIVETLGEMLSSTVPSQPPQLPFDEEQEAPDLGVPAAFWVGLERVHSASKSFDRELWAEGREGSQRVWETLEECGDAGAMAFAREERAHFYAQLERRGEAAILKALDTLSTHIQWILVSGGESMLATGGTRMLSSLTGSSGGPYAIPAGASLDTPNSPAVKSLTYCLRVQFVHVQAALTPESLASFWTALSMRMYDILVARLLQHYSISTVGAVILSRDVEALRSVAMLAGTDHEHWDNLRELLALYMTPPDTILTMLTGPEGESSKGLFSKLGRDRCLVFLSRRQDYCYKTTAGMKKSVWVTEMLNDLNVTDPTDGQVNIGLFAAGRQAM